MVRKVVKKKPKKKNMALLSRTKSETHAVTKGDVIR